jgi:hypothetical protein
LSWIFNYDIIKHIKGCKINIGSGTKSSYNKYKVLLEDVCKKFNELYKITNLCESKITMIPKQLYQQRELIYRKKMMNFMSFLNFEKPKYDQCFYDILINGFKVQEKVASKRFNTKNTYNCAIFRSSTTNNYQTYKLGQNKFYWIHIPDTEIYYIFLENDLCDHRYIESEIIKCKTNRPQLCISLNSKSWYNEYKYSYDNIDIEKMKRLFMKSE